LILASKFLEMNQRLWIVSELFYPDETSTSYILTEIANTLASKYDVHVICGPEVYDRNKVQVLNSSVILDSSITIFRSEGINLDKNKLIGKALRFFLISSRLFRLAKKNIHPNDKVFMVTNPAPLVVLMSQLKKKRAFEFNLLVHDIFPENTRPAGINIPYFFYKPLKKIFDQAYSKADLLIALGRDMQEVLNKKIKHYSQDTKVVVIENWADLENIKMLDRNDVQLQLPTNKIVIEYASNIGRVQGLENILKIGKNTQNKEIEFSFWGTGAYEKKLKLFVAENNIINVKFNGAFLRSEQNKVLNACDLSLVTVSNGMYGLGVPSKTYNILASGRPILFVGDIKSEIAMLVNKNNIGFCFDPSDIEGISGFLENLTFDKLFSLKEKGQNARSLAEKYYSKNSILKKFSVTI